MEFSCLKGISSPLECTIDLQCDTNLFMQPTDKPKDTK